jgi:PAS domain-containing protein
MSSTRKRSRNSKISIENSAPIMEGMLEGFPNPAALLDEEFNIIGANSAWNDLGIPGLREAIRNDDLSVEEQEKFREGLKGVFSGRRQECHLSFPPGILTTSSASIIVRGLHTVEPAAMATIRIGRGENQASPDSLENEANSEPATFETDIEGRIVAWSSSAGRLFNRNEEETVSQHASFLFAQRDFQFPDDDLLAGLRKGRTQKMDLRLKRGSRSFFDGQIVVSSREAGDGTRLICEANVVSERQRAGALRRSDERLRYALEAASDGIWDWNIRTDRVVFTPRVSEILGSVGGGEGMRSTHIDSWNARMHAEDQKANPERERGSGSTCPAACRKAASVPHMPTLPKSSLEMKPYSWSKTNQRYVTWPGDFSRPTVIRWSRPVMPQRPSRPPRSTGVKSISY